MYYNDMNRLHFISRNTGFELSTWIIRKMPEKWLSPAAQGKAVAVKLQHTLDLILPLYYVRSYYLKLIKQTHEVMLLTID